MPDFALLSGRFVVADSIKYRVRYISTDFSHDLSAEFNRYINPRLRRDGSSVAAVIRANYAATIINIIVYFGSTVYCRTALAEGQGIMDRCPAGPRHFRDPSAPLIAFYDYGHFLSI